jgi:DDE superfamily endonuclease
VPELKEILGDTTEQQRQRPQGKRTQRKYYSGKKKRHTFKTEIIVTPAGRILHVSESHPGPMPDLTLHAAEKLPQLIPKETKQYYDRGFQGLQYDEPDHDIRMPYKRKSPGRGKKGEKGRPLMRGQKQANTLRAKRRIPVEHVLARAKKSRILSAIWRSREELYNQTFRGIAALCNFRLAFQMS